MDLNFFPEVSLPLPHPDDRTLGMPLYHGVSAVVARKRELLATVGWQENKFSLYIIALDTCQAVPMAYITAVVLLPTVWQVPFSGKFRGTRDGILMVPARRTKRVPKES